MLTLHFSQQTLHILKHLYFIQMIGDGSTILPNANEDAHTSILNLEAELHKQAENCEKMSLSIKQGAFDLKQKDEEIVQQKHKASSLNRKNSCIAPKYKNKNLNPNFSFLYLIGVPA